MNITKTLFLFFLTVPLYLFAVKYPVINYQTSHGLPQNQINALIQDEKGYIYVGTQSGIGKFDGSEFEVITKKDGLSNNSINNFQFDNNGNLWIGTQEGLSKLDKNNKITTYLPSEYIEFLKNENETGKLWIITNKGVSYLKKGIFIDYDKILNITGKDGREHLIKGLLIAETGVKYFYSSREILEITRDKRHVIESRHKINLLKPVHNKIVVGTKNGLYRLKKGRLVEYIDLPAGMRNVTDTAINEKGNLWVGTENGLLYYKSPSDAPVIITNKNGLTSLRVSKILIDREKNVFIGTKWGLSQLSPNFFKMYDETDGLPHKFVWNFIEDNDRILIACDQGIAELNPENGKITAFSSANRRLKDHSVRTIIKLREYEFLLGTRENGIYEWDRKDRLVRIHADANVFSAAKVPGEIVWFGTDNGLLKYEFKKKQFTALRTGLKDKNVYVLAPYDRDTLLLGTGKGIQKLYREQLVPSDLETKIGNMLINDIRVASPQEVLVATELNGLYIYDEKVKQLRNITTSNGLLHNDVWSVIKDDSGSIWLNTSVSLDRYTNGFISHFNKKTGIFGDEGALHAVFKAGSGKIYFGIIPGFIEIPPQETDIDIKKPILYIKEIKVNGEKKNVPGSEAPLLLMHNQNNIEFQYIAVSTRKKNPVFYKTRLLPLDTNWSEPTQETHIKYLNLTPNDYTFEVIANNGGGENRWFHSQNKITLTIEKPFWLKWWSILLMIVTGILLLGLIIKIRLNSLEKQKKNLEKLVLERTEELGLRNRELAYLSITDPLTDLKNRRYLEEKIKEDISLIERIIYDNKTQTREEAETLDDGMKTGSSCFILGVFILDIDRFKKVNDNYGHKAGDTVIVDIAKVLLEMLRTSDTIVRWGGEEFLIITRQKDKDSSFELAERIRKKIASVDFKIEDGITINKSVSVGFAHFPFIPDDIERVTWSQVLSLADSALYIAKNNGRNLTVGIEYGGRELEKDMDVKEIVSNIKMGIEKNYLKLISVKKTLKISQHKT